MLEYPLFNVSTGLLIMFISFSAVRSRFVLPRSCEYGMPSGRARSCLCRLLRHISSAAMSTSRANPTAPMAMPTLAPVLRLLESLEDGTGTLVLLAGDNEAVGVEADAAVLVVGKFVAIGTTGELFDDEADPVVEVLEGVDAKYTRVSTGSCVSCARFVTLGAVAHKMSTW
jgi:hypothetical protein